MSKYNKKDFIGKTIKDIHICGKYINIDFTDGSKIELEADTYTDYGIDGSYEIIEINQNVK